MAAIGSQARDWVLRLHEHPDDAQLHAAFADWIAGSDAHAEAWTRAERSWQILGEVAHATPALPEPAPVHRHWAGVSRRQMLIGGSAAVAAGLGGFLLISQGDLRTGTGERSRVMLPDGSRVDLDSRTALDVAFDDAHRNISLRKGRAFFDIAHESRRPFLISAGEAHIRVLGTAFAVEQTGDALSVTVARGKVEVRHDRQQSPTSLLPGDGLTIEEDGRFVRRQVDPAYIAAWRNGRIYAANRTVGDVIRELRAYQHGVIVVNAPRLSARPVTGVYHLDNPARTISDLVLAHGGRITIFENYLIYISDA